MDTLNLLDTHIMNYISESQFIKSYKKAMTLHLNKGHLDFVYSEKLILYCFLFICIILVIQHLLNASWEKEKQFSSTASASSSAPKKQNQYSSNNRSDKHKLKCTYHPQFNNHTTEECNLSEDRKKRRLGANKKLSNDNKRPCMYCKEPNWTPEHSRVCKKLTKSKQKKRAIVPTLTSDENNSDDNKEDTDDTEDSEEQNLTFAAMNIKDCEYQYIKEPPRNLLNKNSIILPISLEKNSVKVRTYFLLDTGSSFSSISPRLEKSLEVSIKKSIKGTIKTCKKDAVIDRIGSTEEVIKLTYHSRQCHSKFEIFDIIFDDIDDVVIGIMHLIMKIGINISNMAMDWDDNNNPEIPPIDRNNNPYNIPSSSCLIVLFLQNRRTS